MSVQVVTRIATERYSTELCELVDKIISLGGTTAIEAKLGEDEFNAHFVNEPGHISCFVVQGPDSEMYGFQSLESNSKLAAGWADIATFVQGDSVDRGIGNALFAATLRHAEENRIVSINATIRADNAVGLTYYSRMGFVDYSVAEAVVLEDGTLVDRISKVYSLQ